MKLVVAGTDTGIGKTVFAAGLACALKACYWKPVQAGLEGETDSAFAARMGAKVLPEAYRLNLPMSPHLAAAKDGVQIDADGLAVPDADPLVIETAGGVLTPLSDQRLFADLMRRLKLPVVLCARTSLGTINHSLLSLEALRARGVSVLGMAFIGEANVESEKSICDFGKVKRLGRLPWLDPLTAQSLAKAITENFDMQDFAS
ncbi:ATP-dependent dethiobiotin synthetase BioD [Rhodospirillaceae bacterium LM-1]|nr:ATP-dependent dethiobiotin synthetase BioD [Rhodospirillaceae bacterium LM-1]